LAILDLLRDVVGHILGRRAPQFGLRSLVIPTPPEIAALEARCPIATPASAKRRVIMDAKTSR